MSEATHRPHGGFAPGNPYAFPPGQSGNPGGFPNEYKKLLNQSKLDQLRVGIKARNLYEDCLDDYTDYRDGRKDKLSKALPNKELRDIARTAMDFGLPKPAQASEVETTTSETNPDKMNEAQINVAAKAALERLSKYTRVIDHLEATGQLQGFVALTSESSEAASTPTTPNES